MLGFLNLHKPAGMTSHDCVAIARRHLRLKRVGHGGTLDPAATGVLPIALGAATRLLRFLPTAKGYRAIVRFGQVTDTDDLEGKILRQESAAHLTAAAVQAILPKFLGEIEQIPPQYSAIQVQGQRLYDLARRGEVVAVPSRVVTVSAIRWLSWQPGEFPEATLEIDCGPGTYIRAIARDLGHGLGTGATLARLERTHSCGLSLEDAWELEAFKAAALDQSFRAIAPTAPLKHLPWLTLSPEEQIHWSHGRRFEVPRDRLMAPQRPDAIADPDHENAVCILAPDQAMNPDPDAPSPVLLGIGRYQNAEKPDDGLDNSESPIDRLQIAPQVVLPAIAPTQS